jgi:hypothetical protein
MIQYNEWHRMPLLLLFLFSITGIMAQTLPKWEHLNYSVYFCSREIRDLLSDPEKLKATLDYFAPVRSQKFYLECGSGDENDRSILKQAKEAVRAEGIAVSGALVPNGFGGPFCYNNPEHMALLERRTRTLAGLFDEIIVDDWLFTVCTCPKCVEGRGKKSWAEYRQSLVAEKAKIHILQAARKVNPKVRVIVKYPNWQEGHAWNGYDAVAQTRQFDAVSIGIETRERAAHDQHIPIYSGFVFQKWLSAVDPAKWSSAWLDNYGMKGLDNDYAAQVWQAVFARAPEIILWSAGHLYRTGPSSDVYPHFREMLPEFDRVAGLLKGESTGIPIYLPPGSTGEYNLFGHLGMAGIPLKPVLDFPKDGPVAVFTLNSAQDPKLAEELSARLQNGRDIFLTWKLFKKLQGTEIGKMLQLVDDEGCVRSDRFRVVRSGWDAELIRAGREFVFPKIMTTTWPYVREASLVREDYDFAVLMRVKYLNGTATILNVPDNLYDLQRLPVEVLNSIRKPFAGALGAAFEGPGGVGLYPFGTNQFVAFNMTDERAQIALRLPDGENGSTWKELVHGKQLEVIKPESKHRGESETRLLVKTSVNPFEVVVLERQ